MFERDASNIVDSGTPTKKAGMYAESGDEWMRTTPYLEQLKKIAEAKYLGHLKAVTSMEVERDVAMVIEGKVATIRSLLQLEEIIEEFQELIDEMHEEVELIMKRDVAINGILAGIDLIKEGETDPHLAYAKQIFWLDKMIQDSKLRRKPTDFACSTSAHER